MKKILKKFTGSKDEEEKRDERDADVAKESAAVGPPAEGVTSSQISRAQAVLIRRPWITEKATMLSQENKYVFLVSDECNKSEAKKVIETIYGVSVVKVHSMNVAGKRRRFGATTGTKSGHKKIIVTLEEGQTIDVLPH